MWLVPKVKEKPRWSYIGRVSGDLAIKMCSENLYYRGKYRPIGSWGGKASDRSVPIADRAWYSFLDGRIAANNNQVYVNYIQTIPTTTSRVSVHTTDRTRRFTKMDYKAYKQWKSKTADKRFRDSLRASRNRNNNTILFYLTSSEYGSISPSVSYSIYLSRDTMQARDWSEIDSGQLVESVSFSYVVRERQDTWRTPLKSGEVSIGEAKGVKLDEMLAERVPTSTSSYFQIAHEVLQTLPRMITDPHNYQLNMRWVETLMGLPENMVNPYGEYLIENEAVQLPVEEWRNNG